MKICSFIFVFVVSVLGADDYRTADPIVKAAKDRLLAPSNPDNSTMEPGGIRARAADQSVQIEGVKDYLRPVKKGHQNLQRGWADMYPDLEGLNKLNQAALKSVMRIDKKIKRTHENVQKQLAGFSRDWAGAVLKKAETDPSTFSSTFEPVSQAFVNQYKQLIRGINQGKREMVKDGNLIMRQNSATQNLQEKTSAVIDRKMKLGKFAVKQLLNRKALPLLIGVKYGAAAQIANIGKSTFDAIDKLKDEILVESTKQGVQAMDKSAEVLKISAQKSIANGAKGVQRSLARMRSDLNKLALRQQTWVNKNFTNLDQMLDNALTTIDRYRSNGTQTLERVIRDAADISTKFKEKVFSTAGDLSGMLANEDRIVASVKQQAKLDAQQMSLGFGGQVARLANAMKSIGIPSTDLNNVQSKITSVYSQTSLAVSNSLNQQTRGKAAALVSDASDKSGEISSMFEEVSGQTHSLQSELGTKAGISNAKLQDAQDALTRRTSDMAAMTMGDIDDSTAESEADRANVIARFDKGVSGLHVTVSSQLESVGENSKKRASDLSDQTLKGSEEVINGLSSSQTDMEKQASELAGIEDKLIDVPKKALTKFDAENEIKIKAAFGDLNALRQLAGVRGDQFTTDANNMISDIVAKALASGQLNANPANLSRLASQAANLNNVTLSYKSSIDAFEATMEGEIAKAETAYRNLASSASAGRQLGQIVAHQQRKLADEGRILVREIYNQTNANENRIAKFLVTSPRVNIDSFLAKPLLNTSAFDAKYALALQAELKDLSSKRAETQEGIKQFNQFLERLKTRIDGRLNTDIGDHENLAKLSAFRDEAVKEVQQLQQEMNATISRQFQTAQESISNKTYNFYKQFQTASIMADALVQGFSEYVDKMIAYENATEFQRQVTQGTLIKNIEQHMKNPVLNSTVNGSEIERINSLAKMARDSSDMSAEGSRKRKAATEALVNAVGVEAAAKLQQKYQQMAANADALSQSIQSSVDDLRSDRVSGLEGSKLGLEGVSMETQLFANRAGGVLDAQKQNAKLIAAKIDELMSGGSFLTNITAQELGAIMKNVQSSDGVYRSQLSAYQASNLDSVATFGGVIEAFANLVQRNLGMTTDFIDMMSKNYTALVKKTDAVTLTPVNSIKAELKKTKDKADSVNGTLVQQQLSVGPIEEALQERLDSLNKRTDEFGQSVNKQLNDFVASIHQMDGQIATSREEGMRRLRAAMSSLVNQFRDEALQLQAEKVEQQGSLIEIGTDAEIRSDMKNRIALVKRLVRGHHE